MSMKDEIIAIIADYLDIEPEELDQTSTLDDLKIDSLDFVEIMFEVEEAFDAPLTSDIQEHREEIHNFGDVLRVTEELILKFRASEEGQMSAAPRPEAKPEPKTVQETDPDANPGATPSA